MLRPKKPGDTASAHRRRTPYTVAELKQQRTRWAIGAFLTAPGILLVATPLAKMTGDKLATPVLFVATAVWLAVCSVMLVRTKPDWLLGKRITIAVLLLPVMFYLSWMTALMLSYLMLPFL